MIVLRRIFTSLINPRNVQPQLTRVLTRSFGRKQERGGFQILLHHIENPWKVSNEGVPRSCGWVEERLRALIFRRFATRLGSTHDMKPSTPSSTRRSSRRNKRTRDEGPPLLIRLLKDLPDVVEANVLPLLRIRDHVALAGVNRSCRGALKEVKAVRWLMGQGEEWEKVRLGPSIARRYAVCAKAAQDGRLEVLKWARARGCEWNAKTCECAARCGHLEVLQWARENGCEWDKWTCALAAKGGLLEVLRWARENGCEWNALTCALAAQGGHLRVLRWARENGCEWDAETCALAAGGGHMEMLRWARENGCEWDARTCAYAAEGGHLEVLQWARENGCEWNALTCAYAAKGGLLEVLRWARENGCEWDKRTCA